MPAKILITGEGGQGIQAISKIITKAAKASGKQVTYLPSFGVEQRGGVSISFIQISSNPISYPRFTKADFIVSFCNRTIEPVKSYISDGTLFIYDSSAIEDKYLQKIKDQIKNYVAVPAQKIAKEKYSIKAVNMIMLGALVTHLKEISYAEIENQIIKEFEKKIALNPALKDLNINALKDGINIAEIFDQSKSEFKGIEKKEIQGTFEDDKKKWIRFPEYCKGCALCIVRCPVKALQFSQDSGFLGNPMPIIDLNKCISCNKCMEICPDGAIKFEKK